MCIGHRTTTQRTGSVNRAGECLTQSYRGFFQIALSQVEGEGGGGGGEAESGRSL